MGEKSVLSVLLVGLHAPLSLPEHWRVVGHWEGSPEPHTLTEAVTAPLDVVLIDGDRFFDAALALARHLRAHQLPTKVVIVADRLDQEAVHQAALAGVESVLPRSLLQPLSIIVSDEASKSTTQQEEASSPPPKRQGRVVALCSGRGGVGKTTLLVNLAIALSQETGEPIALLDLFIGDALVLLNATARMTLSEIPEVVREIDLPLLKSFATQHESGVDLYTWFFAPDRNLPEYLDLNRLEVVLSALREGYSYILMDLPATLYVPDLELLKFADEVIVVAVPWDLLSVRATKALLMGMRHWGVTPKLLLNRVQNDSEVTPEFVANQLQLPIWEKIPNQSRLVLHANNSGVPVILSHPESDLGQAIRRAARRLAGLPVEEERPHRWFPFF